MSMRISLLTRRLSPRAWGTAAVVAAAAALSGCVVAPLDDGYSDYGYSSTTVYTNYGYPPPPRVEYRTVSPYPDYVWAGGDWFWSGSRYDWRPGRWVPPGHRFAPPVHRPHSAPAPRYEQRYEQRPRIVPLHRNEPAPRYRPDDRRPPQMRPDHDQRRDMRPRPPQSRGEAERPQLRQNGPDRGRPEARPDRGQRPEARPEREGRRLVPLSSRDREDRQ